VRTDGGVDALRTVLGDLGTVVHLGHDVLDPDDVLDRVLGLGDDGLALVRPDGYLGLVADTADADVLRRYLTDALRVADRATV
jgi:hypothetical protein